MLIDVLIVDLPFGINGRGSGGAAPLDDLLMAS
jgi:hypothetical protein